MGLVQLSRHPAPQSPIIAGGTGPRGKVLLVELPFKTFSRPSIGLSLLKASLAGAGHQCDIRYANLDFAARFGFDTYLTIAERVPEPLLLGDLIFAPAVDARLGRFESLRERGPLFLADGSPLGHVPGWLWPRLPSLQRDAAAFAARCAEEIAESDADIVGFGCMFQTMPSLAVARELKARAPHKWIVFGGSHCEADMGVALHQSYPWIDFVCRGEGERVLVDLVARLAGGRTDFEGIPGLVWRAAGVTRATGGACRVEQMDALPRPDYDDWFAQLRRVAPSLSPGDLELPLETSRGCWYGQKHHCTFCGLNGESMAFRSKSAARVIDEIRDLARYDVPFLYAVDLIFDHHYFDTLLPALAAEGFDHSIFFEIKSNLTRRQMQLLHDARITLIQPGIESLSTAILERMRKGVTACQNVRVLKWAAELGIGVFWTLLYGFPGEEEEAYEHMAELLPALSHLMPPQGGYKVRVDRFSPLLFDAEALGAGASRPAAAYALVHGLPPETLERLAYHFEPVRDERAFDYMRPVAAALRDWREAVGRSSFVGLVRGASLRLFDRRPIAVQAEARLDGVERDVYLACDAGATARAIADSLAQPAALVAAILDRFVARRWVALLDGRFLSLAVMLDEAVPAGVPESVLPAMCHALYVKRIASLGKFVPHEQAAPDGVARASDGAAQ